MVQKNLIERSSLGQLTLELVVALGVFAIGLSALVAAIFGGQSLSVDSEESAQALTLARQNLENAYASAQSNFPGLLSGSSTQNEFLIELIVATTTDANTKQLTSRVSWHTDPVRQQNVTLSGTITNWRDVRNTDGDTGGGGTSGNWQNPQTLGSVNLGPGDSATDLDVQNKIVYLTAVASDPKKNDIIIVDATNGQTPVVVGSTSTGPGLNAIDVASGTAYVADNDTAKQFQVIDVSNISNPVLLTSYSLPGTSGGVGASIFYYDKKVYVGTKAASGPEFHVLDVSNPASPTDLGSFEVGADVNAIRISGNTAYLATSDNNKELKILDVSNPAAISEIGAFNATGTEDGLSLYTVGNIMYLGRAGGTDDNLSVLDVSNPTAIKFLGSKNIGSDINGIAVRDALAFLATAASNQEFQIWNIANPANITFWSSYNFPEVASGIDYEDNIVYVAVRSNDALRIITSQ